MAGFHFWYIPTEPYFTHIDLMAGIGGFSRAVLNEGGKCIYVCEIDPYARRTYLANFEPLFKVMGALPPFTRDIRESEIVAKIPEDGDLLTCGFPCQSFSNIGRKQGLEDVRGNLFFDIARIINTKRPKVILLENVKGLLTHHKGETFKIIEDTLKRAGYDIYTQVLRACDYGHPTYRPRVYIVGFRKDLKISRFAFPPPEPLKTSLGKILGGKCNKQIAYTFRVGGRGSPIDSRHNWDTYLVDGKEHRLTLKEAKEIMGFTHFYFPVSESRAFKLLGNSIAINPVQKILLQIRNTMCWANVSSTTPYAI